MSTVPFLKVLPDEIGHCGADGACLLALVRYMTGERPWWRVSHAVIGAYLGGMNHDKVQRIVSRLEAAGKLVSRSSSLTDRLKEYRAADIGDQSLRKSASSTSIDYADPRRHDADLRNVDADPRPGLRGSAFCTPSKEPKTESSTPVSALTTFGNAPARNSFNIDDTTFYAATSEVTNLSPVVSIGATRLVAAVIRDRSISDADRTILRIKTSEGMAQGRSDDDMADCLRIWLTKNELGPHGLLCCLTEVDKRKINQSDLPTSERNFLRTQSLKTGSNRKELR